MSVLPISPSGRRYGLFPDNPYHPARLFLAMKLDPKIATPPRASTSQWMGPIRNQGQEGSCTGQMGAAVLDLLVRKNPAMQPSIPAGLFESSASFLYKCNLIADGDLGLDAGSTIHQTFVTLNQRGACLESVEPYSDSDFSTVPTTAQYTDALLHKPGAYHYLPSLATMKQCIASGYSFGFGIQVYSSFEGEWEAPGMMPMPRLDAEELLGGHAQHAMDYDDDIAFPDGSKGGLLIQNSWDREWGISAPGRTDGGCYWMPYDFVNAGLASDAWMIHWGKAWK